METKEAEGPGPRPSWLAQYPNENGQEMAFGKRLSVEHNHMGTAQVVDTPESRENMMKKIETWNMESERDLQADAAPGGLLQRCCRVLAKSFTWQKLFLVKGKWIWWPVMVPDCRPTFTWEIVGVWFLIFELISIPYRISFDSPAKGMFKLLQDISVCFFLLDIIFQFFQGFFQNGHQVMEPKEIILKYLQSWFWIDILASFPWVWAFGPTDGSEQGAGLNAANLPQLIRVVRILKLPHLVNRIEIYAEMFYWGYFCVALARVILFMVLLSHFCACFWYFAGVSGLPEVCKGKPWECRSEGDYWSWLVAIDFSDPSWQGSDNRLLMYLQSFYFVMTTITTVGYGDIHPVSQNEKRFAVAMFLVAIIAFSACVGSISEIMKTVHQSKGIYRNQMKDLARYMRWRRLPLNLQIRLRRYLQYLWEHKSDLAEKEERILAQISPSLRKEVCSHLYGKQLQRVPFLKWATNHRVPFETMLTGCRSTFGTPGEMLFFAGQMDTTIYIVTEGRIAVVGKDDEKAEPEGDNEDNNSEKHFTRKLSEAISYQAALAGDASCDWTQMPAVKTLDAPCYIGESNIWMLDILTRPVITKSKAVASSGSFHQKGGKGSSPISKGASSNGLFSRQGKRSESVPVRLSESNKLALQQPEPPSHDDSAGALIEDGSNSPANKQYQELRALQNEALDLSCPRAYTAVCLSHCQLTVLGVETIADMLKDYPFVWSDYDEFKRQREKEGGGSRSCSKDLASEWSKEWDIPTKNSKKVVSKSTEAGKFGTPKKQRLKFDSNSSGDSDNSVLMASKNSSRTPSLEFDIRAYSKDLNGSKGSFTFSEDHKGSPRSRNAWRDTVLVAKELLSELKEQRRGRVDLQNEFNQLHTDLKKQGSALVDEVIREGKLKLSSMMESLPDGGKPLVDKDKEPSICGSSTPEYRPPLPSKEPSIPAADACLLRAIISQEIQAVMEHEMSNVKKDIKVAVSTMKTAMSEVVQGEMSEIRKALSPVTETQQRQSDPTTSGKSLLQPSEENANVQMPDSSLAVATKAVVQKEIQPSVQQSQLEQKEKIQKELQGMTEANLVLQSVPYNDAQLQGQLMAMRHAFCDSMQGAFNSLNEVLWEMRNERKNDLEVFLKEGPLRGVEDFLGKSKEKLSELDSLIMEMRNSQQVPHLLPEKRMKSNESNSDGASTCASDGRATFNSEGRNTFSTVNKSFNSKDVFGEPVLPVLSPNNLGEIPEADCPLPSQVHARVRQDTRGWRPAPHRHQSPAPPAPPATHRQQSPAPPASYRQQSPAPPSKEINSPTTGEKHSMMNCMNPMNPWMSGADPYVTMNLNMPVNNAQMPVNNAVIFNMPGQPRDGSNAQAHFVGCFQQPVEPPSGLQNGGFAPFSPIWQGNVPSDPNGGYTNGSSRRRSPYEVV